MPEGGLDGYLKVYLTVRFGKPNSMAKEADVKGKPGILMFGLRHVDLWDGNKVARIALFGDPSVNHNGLFLWPDGTTSE